MGKLQIVVGLVVVALAAACGGGDECERFFDKTKPIFEKQAKERGKTITDADKARFVEECRKAKKEGKSGDDGMMKCVLEASGEAAVAACMQPAFGDYMKKSKKTEADLQLTKIGKMAKVYYMEHSAFPTGSSPPRPSAPCCGQPDNKCAVVPAAEWAADPIFGKLDFQMDEPGYYRYSAESDGKKLVVKAAADLDCDTTESTYTLEVTAQDGNPTVQLTPPTTMD